MNVLFLVFYCVVQFPSVISLKCYQCKATNEASCLESQKPVDCRENQNDACMTVSYSVEKGEIVRNYRKRCWKSHSDCLGYCSLYDDLKNCQFKCCTGDLCNRHGIQEVIKDNKKRSTDRNSATHKTQHNSILVLTGIFFIVYCS